MGIMGLIQNGIIHNIVVCDGEEFAKILWPNDDILNVTDMNPRPGIGWFLSGSQWIDPSTQSVSGSVSGSV
jgi:hypothetical protein